MPIEQVLSSPTRMPRSAKRALQLLRQLDGGCVRMHLPSGQQLRLGQPQAGQPELQLRLLHWGVFDAVLARGGVGFADSYRQGQWTTSDLPALLQLMLRNRNRLLRLLRGSRWGAWLLRLRHALRRNSRAGSRSNISAHYDIGNAFYQLWLDPGMTYSSAWYRDPGMTLEQAQQAKLERALQQLQLQPGQRVLEIGCGWGSLAEAAARSGLQVDAISLSQRQLDYARTRMAEQQLDHRVALHARDYRDLAPIAPSQGWDGVVSIEMFEAVGQAYWPGYFRALHDALRPGGHACVQTITIADDLFDDYASHSDFIQQYVFPGGMLPSRERFVAAAAAAGLELVTEHAFGADYATTLAAWRHRFLQQLPQVERMGYDRRFQLLWEFYLAYCEAGFAESSLDVVQFTLRRPAAN